MTIDDRAVREPVPAVPPRQVRLEDPPQGIIDRRRPTVSTRVSWADRQPFVRLDGPPTPSISRWREPEPSQWRSASWKRSYTRRAVLGDVAVWVLVLSAVLATLPVDVMVAAVGVVVSGLVWLLALLLNRGFDGRRLGSGPEEFQSVMRATWLVVAVLAIAAYTTHTALPRRIVFIGVPLAGVLTAVHRYLLRRRLHRDRGKGKSMLRTLVVGDVAAVVPVVADLRRASYHGYQVVGACLPSCAADGAGNLVVPALGTVGDVPQVVVDHKIDVVIVAGSQLAGQALRRLSWALDRVGADLVVSPGVVEVAGPHIRLRPTAGLSLLHLEQPSRHLGRELGKTVVDRLLGSVLLLAALGPLVLMSIAIAVTSPGPVFFRQQRAGVDGRPFTMWKMRTMVVDAEKRLTELFENNDTDGLMFKMRRDPRITPVGRILRRFSLDELPQLWNVVRGDMSLVGPRPPLMSEVERYHDAVNRRLRVRPGVTGLWQVSGRADLAWDESVNIDLRYVDNWSLALDLQILWKTFRAVVRGSGAY